MGNNDSNQSRSRKESKSGSGIEDEKGEEDDI